MESKKMLDVFAIPESQDGSKKAWPKIGVAFVNKDNSLNVILDLFPRVGKIHIREQAPSITKNNSGDNL
jgi:hypothetical protein